MEAAGSITLKWVGATLSLTSAQLCVMQKWPLSNSILESNGSFLPVLFLLAYILIVILFPFLLVLLRGSGKNRGISEHRFTT
jgi:hypothetical protein